MTKRILLAILLLPVPALAMNVETLMHGLTSRKQIGEARETLEQMKLEAIQARQRPSPQPTPRR